MLVSECALQSRTTGRAKRLYHAEIQDTRCYIVRSPRVPHETECYTPQRRVRGIAATNSKRCALRNSPSSRPGQLEQIASQILGTVAGNEAESCFDARSRLWYVETGGRRGAGSGRCSAFMNIDEVCAARA